MLDNRSKFTYANSSLFQFLRYLYYKRVQLIRNLLNFVNKLEPVTYKWDKRANYLTPEDIENEKDLDTVTADGTHKDDQVDLGFLAQDVEKLEEAAGHKMSDKTNLTTNLTEDGKQYGLKYAKFVPILVNAIQELSSQVSDLKEQLDKCNCNQETIDGNKENFN